MDNINKLIVLSIVITMVMVGHWLILELFGQWGSL